MNKKKWSNYFCNIENKYNLSLNRNNPIVIFVDGKDITKSLQHNLISENKNSFNDIFEQTIKYFSEKLDCIAISGVDEVSFIVDNSRKLKDCISIRSYKAHEINSIFSQYFYKYFNDRYSNPPVYWHCKCSNIPRGKIISYVIHRSETILELTLTYFLKRKQIQNAGKIELSKKKLICSEMADYKEIKKFEKGKLYISGKQVDLEAFLNNEIIEVKETKRRESEIFLDINKF